MANVSRQAQPSTTTSLQRVDNQSPSFLNFLVPYVVPYGRFGKEVRCTGSTTGTVRPIFQSSSLRNRTIMEDEVRFVDTDGDEVIFRMNQRGGMDYYVNGKMKVRDLDQLREKGGSITLHGVAMGPWNAARRTTPKDPSVIEKVLNLGRTPSDGSNLQREAREVSFKDTDGDEVIFRVTANGSIQYLVNGKLKVRDLDALGQRDGSIVLHGIPMGNFSGSRRTTPLDPGIIDEVLGLTGDSSKDATEEERKGLVVGFKDADGDHIWFKRSPEGSLSYWVNDKEKVRELTSLEAVGRVIKLKGMPCDGDPRNTGSRRTTPNNSRVIPRVLALRHGNDELLKPLEISIRLLKMDSFVRKASELHLTSDQVNQEHWGKHGNISRIFREEDFKLVPLVDLSNEDYAVLTYRWSGSIWSDMVRVLRGKVSAEHVWIEYARLDCPSPPTLPPWRAHHRCSG